MPETSPYPPREREWPVAVLTIWCILLVLGSPIALLGTGTAFDGGDTLSAYLFVTNIWSYPVLLAVAFFGHKKLAHPGF